MKSIKMFMQTKNPESNKTTHHFGSMLDVFSSSGFLCTLKLPNIVDRWKRIKFDSTPIKSAVR